MQFDLDGLVVLYVAVLGKVDMVKDGFAPEKVSDPLYFLDHEKKTYVRVDKELYDRIQAGKVRI